LKTALICGIGGQDGSLLAKFLLNKGYKVYGTSRDAQGGNFINLKRLGIIDNVTLLSMAPEDFRSVYVTIIQSQPDEIFFLAGQSSVGLSFEQPAETIQSFTLGTLNVLEACRMTGKLIRQYHAGSSECFGNTFNTNANESTPFRPKSPYSVAKSAAYWLTANYREAYGLYACTGILFNHESILRPSRFVTQKIIQAAKRIAAGSDEVLTLGNLDIKRDWGWAPEYVDAMWRMLQLNEPRDFVIATGVSSTLREFVVQTFNQLNLDWQKYVVINPDLFRPSEIVESHADSSLAYNILDWKAKVNLNEIISKMIKNEI
jgi:GDPmannose 4,6-dehydratase